MANAEKIEISNLEELKAFRDAVNAGESYKGKTVVLTADIDLKNEEWTPIGNSTNQFQGNFDGQGHTVSNLKISGNKSNVGFFGFTTNGSVSNLTIENASVSGRLNVGVVAGTPYTSKYTNIKVTGHVEVEGMAYVGGVGGKNAYADWTDITVDVDETSFVKADSVENGTAYRTYVGGVIGFMGEGGHTLKNITSNINVEGSTCDVGGIVGIAHYGNNLENVTCKAKEIVVNNDDAEVGAIAGVWHNASGYTVTMVNCTASGTTRVKQVVTDENGNTTTTELVNAVNGAAYTVGNTGDASGKLLMATEKVNSDGSVSVNITKVDAAGTTYDASAEASKILNVDASQISSTDGVYTSAVTYKAKIGSVYYESFEAALDAAKNGDEITLLSNISDAEYTIDKNITIRGNVTLNNVDIKVNASLALYGLKFTGTSDILTASTATALTLENCTADVDPGKYSGRGAFITTGQSESSNQALKLVLKNNVINSAQSSNDLYSAAVFGWAYLGHVEMTGNTFGSASNPYTFVAVKTMNATPGAVFNIANNTVYGSDSSFTFYAFDLYQNNSRENEYTAVFNNNSVVNTNTASSANGFYFSRVEVNVYGGIGGNASVQVLDNNTVNGEKVTAADVQIDDKKAIDYVGTDVKLDSYGNIVGGNFTVEDSAAFREDLAAGMAPQVNADGSVTPVAFDATKFYVSDTYSGNPGDKVGEGLYFDYNAFASLKDAADKAVDGTTIELLSNGKAAANFDGGGTVTLTGTADLDWSGNFLFIGRGTNAQDTTVIIKDAVIGSASDQNSTGFHVSGAEKDSSSKANGTLIIDKSAVVTDYLINKNVVDVIGDGDYNDNEIDLTVKNGFGVAGRPSGETPNGTAHTAVMNITNGAYVKIGNENGMGIGHYDADEGKGVDGKGILNITDSKFESTQYLNVRTHGTVNVTNGELVVAGNLNNSGAVNITDSALEAQTVANSGSIQVFGDSKLTIGSLTGSEIQLLSGSTLTGSTVGGDLYVRGTVSFKGDNVFNQIYDFGTYNGNSHWTVEEGASVWLTGTIDGTNRYGLGYGDKVTINGLLADADAARVQLANGEEVFCSFRSDKGLIGSNNSGFNDLNSFVVNDAYVDFAKGDQSFGTKGGRGSSGSYGNYEFIFNNAVVDANRFTFYDTDAKTVLNATDSNILLGSQLMTKDADSVFTFTNSTVTVKNPNNGNDEDNVNGGTLNLINSKLIYANAGNETEYQNNGALNVKSGALMDVSNLKLVNAGMVGVSDDSVLKADELFNGGTIHVSGSTIKVNGAMSSLKTVPGLSVEGESTIQIGNLDGRVYILDGAVLNNSYIKSAGNGTTHFMGSATLNGGFAAAYFLGSSAGVGGTLTIDGTVNVSYGVEFSKDYTLNGGKIKLSGGNADGNVWGCVFQSGSYTIKTDIEVIGGGATAPIHFTNAAADVYSTISQSSSGGEVIYLKNSTVNLKSGGRLESEAGIHVNSGSVLNISVGGTIVANNLVINDGTVVLDASGFTSGVKKVIDLKSGSSLENKITVNNLGEGVNVVYGSDGDVTLVKKEVGALYVKDTYTSGDAVNAEVGGNLAYGVDAFSSVKSAFEKAIELGGGTINVLGTPAEIPMGTDINGASLIKMTGASGMDFVLTGTQAGNEFIAIEMRNAGTEAEEDFVLVDGEKATLLITDVNMAAYKLAAYTNSVITIENSVIDFRDNQSGPLYTKGNGEMYITNSAIKNLVQLSARGALMAVTDSLIDSGSGNTVYGGTMSLVGSTFNYSGVRIGDGGVLTIKDTKMVSNSVKSAKESANTGTIGWEEIALYVGYGNATNTTGTLNLKNAEFSIAKGQSTNSSTGALADTTAGTVYVSESGTVNVEDSKFSADVVNNTGNFNVSGVSQLNIASLDGDLTIADDAVISGALNIVDGNIVVADGKDLEIDANITGGQAYILNATKYNVDDNGNVPAGSSIKLNGDADIYAVYSSHGGTVDVNGKLDTTYINNYAGSTVKLNAGSEVAATYFVIHGDMEIGSNAVVTLLNVGSGKSAGYASGYVNLLNGAVLSAERASIGVEVTPDKKGAADASGNRTVATLKVNDGATFNYTGGKTSDFTMSVGGSTTEGLLDVDGGVVNVGWTQDTSISRTDVVIGEKGKVVLTNGAELNFIENRESELDNKGLLALTDSKLIGTVVPAVAWHAGEEFTLINGGTFTAVNSDISVDNLTNNGTITIDADSLITAGTLTNSGTITIDAKGYTGDSVKIIDLSQNGQLTNVSLKNGNNKYYLAYGADGDVTLMKSPEFVYVSSDYNSSTEGWGVTKFGSWDGAYAFTSTNAKKATIVFEKTTTISGNCFPKQADGVAAIIVKDGAAVGNANSKWDAVFAMTIEAGGILQSARPASAGYGNTHVKNKWIIGEAGADKRAEIRFINGKNGINYKTMSIALLSGFNRSITANNALIEVGDFGINAAASFTDTTLTIEGILAIKGTSLYKTTMTDTEVTIKGHNLMNENEYYSTVGTILSTLTMDNTSIVVDDGVESDVAEKVWLGYTGNAAQTLTMTNGSSITVEKGTAVEVANTVIMTGSTITAGDVNAGDTKYAGSNSFYFNQLEKGKVYYAVLYDAEGNELETIVRTSTSGSTFYPKFSAQPAGSYKAVCYKDAAKTEVHQEKTYTFIAVGSIDMTESKLYADKLSLAGSNVKMDIDSTIGFNSITGGHVTVTDANSYVDNDGVNDGNYLLFDYTGDGSMSEADYKAILNDQWHNNYKVINNDLYLTDQNNDILYVNSTFTGGTAGGHLFGYNAFNSFADALDAVTDGGNIVIEDSDFSEASKEIEFTKDIAFTISGTAPAHALPIVTFQNAEVTVEDAEILIPELDVRQNAVINVDNSIVHDAGGNSIVKSYYNGAINLNGSTVYTMQTTTMGYITINNATLNTTWQTNVYGNGLITVTNGANFNTAALHLTSQDYSGRDNTDADRVGKAAEIIVDNAAMTVGKVFSDGGADYSYNSSKGMNIGTVDGKNAILTAKNNAKVEFWGANGETVNIGAGGTVSVSGSTFSVGCRAENGTVTLNNAGTITLNDTDSVTVQSLIVDHGVINLTNSTLTVDGVITFKAYDWSSGSLNIVFGTGNAINMDWQSQVVVGSWAPDAGDNVLSIPAMPTISVDVTGIESSGKTAFKVLDTLDGSYPNGFEGGEIIGTGAEEWHLEAVNGDAYLTSGDQSVLYVNSAYANDEDGIIEDSKIVGYNAFANLDDAFKVNNAEKIVLKSSGLALNGNADYNDSFSSAKKADFTLTADEAVTVTFNGNNQLVGNVVLDKNVNVILKGIDGKAAGLLLGSKGDTNAAGNTYQINGSIVNDGIAHFYVRNHKETVDVNGEIKILHFGNNQIYNKGTMNVTGTGKNYGVDDYQVTADFINVNGVVDANGVRKGGELNLVDTAANFTTFRLGNGDDETCSTVNVNNSFLKVGGFISENSSAQIKLTGSTLNYSNVPVNVGYGNAVIGLGTDVSMTLDNSTVDAAALLSYGAISAVNGSKLDIETFTNNGTVSINDATFTGNVLTVAEYAAFNAVDSYVDLSGNSSANYGEMSISGGSFKASRKVYNYGTIEFTNANVSLNSIDMSGSGVSGKVVIVDSCVNMSSSFAMNKSASEVYVDNSVLNCTQFQMGFGGGEYATGTGKVTIVNGSVVTMSNTPSASYNCNQTITIDATSRMVADGINYYSENGKYTITIDISNYAGGTNKIIDVNRYSGDMANISIRGTLPTNAQLIYGADGDVIITDTELSVVYANTAWTDKSFGDTIQVADGNELIYGITAFKSLTEAISSGIPVVLQSDVSESIENFYSGAAITTDKIGGVTIDNTYDDYYIGIGKLDLGANVTLKGEDIYFNDRGSVSTIAGTVSADSVMYVSGQPYEGSENVNVKVNVTETGKFTSGGVVIIRYNGYADSGVYVVGDGSKTEASYRSADYTGLYSGTLSIKDAKAEVGYMLLKNSYDAAGSSYAGASLVLDNALFVSNGQFSIDSNAALNATNGSEISVAGFMDVASGSQVSLTGSTVTVNNSVSNAGTFEMDFTSTLAFVSLTNSGTFTIDLSQYSDGAFKVLDSINNNYTVEMYQALLGNAYDNRFIVVNGDLFIADFADSEIYVNNNSYSGNVGDVTADGKIIGVNAFATVDDAVAAGAQSVTVSGGEYGKTGFDGVKATIGNVTYSGAVYGGNCDENAVVSETIDLTISGGELQSAVYGGSRVHGGTSFTSGGICAVAGDVNVKVTSGSVQNVFVGGDLVTQALMFVREGDINVNISGGEFNDRVYGGITVHATANASCMAQLAGNINMTISGGDFNDRVYGGNLAGKYERGDKLTVTGNISVALDVSSNSVSFAEHLVLGSSGTSAVHGNTKLTLTGLGSNLTFADNSVIVGGSGDSYYLVEGGNRTPVSFVEGTKEFAFNAFTGALNAQIKIFDTMSFAGNSEVNFADSAINLDEISNWNFESGSLITGAANAISFNGDTINLNGSWEAGAAFELGNIDAFGDYTAWNDVTVYYGGSAVNYQFEEKESKLVITKLA